MREQREHAGRERQDQHAVSQAPWTGTGMHRADKHRVGSACNWGAGMPTCADDTRQLAAALGCALGPVAGAVVAVCAVGRPAPLGGVVGGSVQAAGRGCLGLWAVHSNVQVLGGPLKAVGNHAARGGAASARTHSMAAIRYEVEVLHAVCLQAFQSSTSAHETHCPCGPSPMHFAHAMHMPYMFKHCVPLTQQWPWSRRRCPAPGAGSHPLARSQAWPAPCPPA